jgi:SAM-dependent methyltransferase
VSTADFYDQMTPFYHLLYAKDLDAAMEYQSRVLDTIIQQHWGAELQSVLDVSCGIGTQSLGLAQRGYQVTASDLSANAIERAKREAALRGLTVDFSVADMRQAYDHHGRQFDIVLSADNAVPHLLSDDEILVAFKQFFKCCKPGGGCIVTVRDYESEDLTSGRVIPYGMKVAHGIRYLVFQVWEFDGPIYELSMYFVQDEGAAECKTRVMRTKYYAIGAGRLMELMEQAGFEQVKKIDEVYFQPVIIGTRKVEQ